VSLYVCLGVCVVTVFLSVCVCVCSIAESDSLDAESAADESDINEVGVAVARFVTRFIDKVCTESSVRADHIKSLHQMIPGHLDVLMAVVSECSDTYRVNLEII